MDDNSGGKNHHGKLEVSPSVAALFGVGFAFVLMTIFHLIYVGWCKNTSGNPSRTRTHDRLEETSSSSVTNDVSGSRLQLIVTTRYGKERKEDDCAVCLSQFVQGDEVRVLMRCGHVFHVSCIDMWLRSHSTCPLCRVNTVAGIR